MTNLEELSKETYWEIADHFTQTRKKENYSDIVFALEKSWFDDDFKWKKILDIWCGSWRFFRYLKDNKYLDNIRYNWIDNSKEFIDICKKEFKWYDEIFKLWDFLNIPNKDFDYIFCFASFHHLQGNKSRLDALNTMKTKLSNDWKLILVVWNLYQKRYINYVLLSYIKSLNIFSSYKPWDCIIPWKKWSKVFKRYYYAFTRNKLKRILISSWYKWTKVFLQNNKLWKVNNTKDAMNIISISKKSSS